MSAARTAIEQEFYITGGTMRPDAPSYVERRADQELFDGLMRGEFCYVLTSRQMGKSSLMIRTAGKLRQAGIGVAALDLTAVGQNLTVEQWYAGLILQLGQRLDLSSLPGMPSLEDALIEFWGTHPMLGPLQRWLAAIRTVVLPNLPGRLVIFIDEIDAVRSLPFPTDEFFAGIRECYNLRGEDKALERLTFGLFGVATPADLIQDARTTPFNIGRRIELLDFSGAEAVPLAQGLKRDRQISEAMLKRILYWSGGHPFLTQRLCQIVAADAGVRESGDVDRVCDGLFFTSRARERDDNLLFVRERMLREKGDLAGLLELYGKALRGRRVADDEANPLVSVLRLSGITRADSGRLKVRNRIYARVFDRAWIALNMPDAELRRQRAAFRRGAFRIAAVSAVILAVVGWLAITALNESEARRRLLYLRQIGLAWQEWADNSNIDRVNELLRESAPRPGQEDLRSFEWRLLRHLAQREVRSFRSGNEVLAASFSADGKTIADVELMATVGEYLIGEFDRETGAKRHSFTIPAGANFNPVAFSSDGMRVAVEDLNHNVALWDLQRAALLTTFKGTGSPLSAIVFSPQDRFLAAADLNGAVKLLDAATGLELFQLSNSADRIVSLAFSPDGKRLAAAAHDSSVLRLWDVERKRELAAWKSSEGHIAGVAFFPDGERVLISTTGGKLYACSLTSKSQQAFPSAHEMETQSMSFSPDGRKLATASYDRTVKLWSAETGKLLATIKGHGAGVNTVAWSPDGGLVATASADGSLKLWDSSGQSDTQPPDGSALSYLATAFSSRNEPIAFGATPGNLGRIWNLETGEVLATLLDAEREAAFPSGSDREILCAAFSPDGKLLATGGKDAAIQFWDTATGRLRQTLREHSEYVYSLDFSPDGTLLISGGQDRTLLLWTVADGRLVAALKGQGDNSYRARFSPDGNRLATATRDGGVLLWDVATRRVLRAFTGHGRKVKAIAFAPDGGLLATGGDDNELRLWDVSSGRTVREFGQSDQVVRLSFSPDARRLISGGVDGTIKLWDIQTGQEIFTIKGHKGQVTSILFAPDGASLVTSSLGGSIRVWRTAP